MKNDYLAPGVWFEYTLTNSGTGQLELNSPAAAPVFVMILLVGAGVSLRMDGDTVITL